ncbi:MAG: OmpA family protein [Ignavibacteriales bacterium]|nr:OmpA family protein [Ignavibacteriales bacterium]
MKKRSRKHEEPDNQDRWLLTYADLITLLLGLFVILYAMSKIDGGKYEAIVAAFGDVFGGSHPAVVNAAPQAIDLPVATLVRERKQIEEMLAMGLKKAIASGMISVSQNERGITVHIMEELLFASGSAVLKQNSLSTMDTLASLLKTLPNDIRVEGHTDNVPISTAQFPSNWHLSVARAVNTGFYLIEKHQLNAEKVTVVGFSEYQPLVPNTTAENRARNRRVDIVIVTNLAQQSQPETQSGH